MTGWHYAHLICVAAWAGLVLGEIVIELAARGSPALAKATATLHRKIDLAVEIPLLVGVVLTGLNLIGHARFDLPLMVKVTAGLGAIGVNLACAAVVIRRSELGDSDADAIEGQRLTRWVFRSVYVGVPLGLTAFYLGADRLGII